MSAPLAAEAGLDRRGARSTLGRFGDEPGFGLTPLALRLSAYANGVSELHGEVAREMWAALWPGQETPIGHVTNGVHLGTWLDPALTELLRAAGVSPEAPPDEANWDAREARSTRRRSGSVHAAAKARLAERAGIDRERADDRLRPPLRDLQARRPRLLRPRAAARAAGPDRRRRQGAPADDAGKDVMQAHRRARPRSARSRAASSSSRTTTSALARTLVRGCDVWLNTPTRARSRPRGRAG